jgi:hypothetical protein
MSGAGESWRKGDCGVRALRQKRRLAEDLTQTSGLLRIALATQASNLSSALALSIGTPTLRFRSHSSNGHDCFAYNCPCLRLHSADASKQSAVFGFSTLVGLCANDCCLVETSVHRPPSHGLRRRLWTARIAFGGAAVAAWMRCWGLNHATRQSLSRENTIGCCP